MTTSTIIKGNWLFKIHKCIVINEFKGIYQITEFHGIPTIMYFEEIRIKIMST
jgi:hypothetical protein